MFGQLGFLGFLGLSWARPVTCVRPPKGQARALVPQRPPGSPVRLVLSLGLPDRSRSDRLEAPAMTKQHEAKGHERLVQTKGTKQMKHERASSRDSHVHRN